MSETLNPLKILLVEDDPGHAVLIKKNLLRSGVTNEIIHFDNGKKVLDFIFGAEGSLNETFSIPRYLVLLDLNLPIIDGYQVLETLKIDARTRHIFIIILTTTTNDLEIKRCYDSGCNIYLSKPVKYEKFAEAVQKLGLLLAFVDTPKGSLTEIQERI